MQASRPRPKRFVSTRLSRRGVGADLFRHRRVKQGMQRMAFLFALIAVSEAYHLCQNVAGKRSQAQQPGSGQLANRSDVELEPPMRTSEGQEGSLVNHRVSVETHVSAETKSLSEKGSDPLQRRRKPNDTDSPSKGLTPFRIGSKASAFTSRRDAGRSIGHDQPNQQLTGSPGGRAVWPTGWRRTAQGWQHVSSWQGDWRQPSELPALVAAQQAREPARISAGLRWVRTQSPLTIAAAQISIVLAIYLACQFGGKAASRSGESS